MRAGLLADLIFGEDPELKNLISHFNFLILNPKGKITGFNHHMLRNFGKHESALMNQNFFVLFQPEDGNADLAIRIKSVLKGNPEPFCFRLPEENLLFKGVALPVFGEGDEPDHLIILCKEEKTVVEEEDALNYFWAAASEFLNQTGISMESCVPEGTMKKPRILLIEDPKGLVVKIFNRLLKSGRENVVLAPGAEAALLMAAEFKPHAVISAYEPIGNLSGLEIRDKMKGINGSSTILVSSDGGEIRIEDGWLDIHVKNQAESVSKILDLINEIYLNEG
jgi:hypothetical protein